MKEIEVKNIRYNIPNFNENLHLIDRYFDTSYYRTENPFDFLNIHFNKNFTKYDTFGSKFSNNKTLPLNSRVLPINLYQSVSQYFSSNLFTQFVETSKFIKPVKNKFLNLNSLLDVKKYKWHSAFASNKEIHNYFSNLFNIEKILKLIEEIKLSLGLTDSTITFNFANKELCPLTLDTTNIFYNYGFCTFQYFHRSSFIFNTFDKELVALFLSSLELIFESLLKFLNEIEGSFINEVLSYKRPLVFNNSIYNQYYPLPGLLNFFSTFDNEMNLFEQIKGKFKLHIKNIFSYSSSIFNQNSAYFVTIDEYENWRDALNCWIKYWITKLNPPYKPEEFLYFVSHFFTSQAGYFSIASPPGSNSIRYFARSIR